MLHPTVLTTLNHFSVVLPYSPLHQCNIQCLIRSENEQKIEDENTVLKKAKGKAKEMIAPASLLQICLNLKKCPDKLKEKSF